MQLSQEYNLLTLSTDMGAAQTDFVVFRNSSSLVSLWLRLNKFTGLPVQPVRLVSEKGQIIYHGVEKELPNVIVHCFLNVL